MEALRGALADLQDYSDGRTLEPDSLQAINNTGLHLRETAFSAIVVTGTAHVDKLII